MRLFRLLPLFLFILIVFVAFRPFLLKQNIPTPADALIGLYHPFRDLYAPQYPNGIPFKNFLITDPVLQQYPWRFLSTSLEKSWQLPLWNPYSFSGTPLLGNFQSGVFYPLNSIFFLLPFSYAWTILIMLQPFLAAVFLYLYLRKMNLHPLASFVGSVTFSFCGFSIAWMEWNTIMHTALWLPLILLSEEHLLRKRSVGWIIVFLLAEISAAFAGHLQTYFYILLVSNVYLFCRIIQVASHRKSDIFFESLRIYIPFLLLSGVVFVVTAIQWIPTLQFIAQSARAVDQADWQTIEGWFIPLQHLAQFIAPDFYGNPTTLNYWGSWNYGEFVGYVGIVPLLFAVYAMLLRRDKKTLFFGALAIVSLVFATQNILATLPYLWHIPFLSTTQPTRLLFVTDFSLAVLCALGIDSYMKQKKGLIFSFVFIYSCLSSLWITILFGKTFGITTNNLLVARQNLLLPTAIVVMTTVLLVTSKLKRKYTTTFFLTGLFLLTVFDLLRVFEKFTPFSSQEYLYPPTKMLSFLQQQSGNFRIMATDRRILPPNVSMMYHLEEAGGYDPLYLLSYGELIAASERGKPNISPPFGFNRIITPQNIHSPIVNLLGIRYILSFDELSTLGLKKVFEEGQTKLYENTNAFPRVFFVQRVQWVNSKTEAINRMFDTSTDLRTIAIVEKSTFTKGGVYPTEFSLGKSRIVSYNANKVVVETENDKDGFLVLIDSYYPNWKAEIYSEGTSLQLDNPVQAKIEKVDYNFRGIFIPQGKHTVVFTIQFMPEIFNY